MTKPQTIEELIYSILFQHSKASGVRLLYEDEWPIKELGQAITDHLLSLPELMVDGTEGNKTTRRIGAIRTAIKRAMGVEP